MIGANGVFVTMICDDTVLVKIIPGYYSVVKIIALRKAVQIIGLSIFCCLARFREEEGNSCQFRFTTFFKKQLTCPFVKDHSHIYLCCCDWCTASAGPHCVYIICCFLKITFPEINFCAQQVCFCKAEQVPVGMTTLFG